MAFSARHRWFAAIAIVTIVSLIVAKSLHLRSYVISHSLTASPPPWGPGSRDYNGESLQQSRRSQQIDHAIVFFGDSITVGLATSNVAAKSENFGIGNDTIEGLTTRLATYSLINDRAVVLEIGINNVMRNRLDGFVSKYQRLLKLVPSLIPVIAIGITPIPASFGGPSHRAVRETNTIIERICRQRENCLFLDLFSALADGNGLLQPSYDVGDGIHPSTAGYAVLTKMLVDQISRLPSIEGSKR